MDHMLLLFSDQAAAGRLREAGGDGGRWGSGRQPAAGVRKWERVCCSRKHDSLGVRARRGFHPCAHPAG